jgi:hypothetical protein
MTNSPMTNLNCSDPIGNWPLNNWKLFKKFLHHFSPARWNPKIFGEEGEGRV